MIFVIWDVSKTAVRRDATDSFVLGLINQVLTQPVKFRWFRLTPTGQGKAELKMTHCNEPCRKGAQLPLDTGCGTETLTQIECSYWEQGEGFASVLLPWLL